jgi:galactonate dehydratase
LKRSTRVPLLAGEKVEMVEGFRPYLDNQVLDMIHPDVASSRWKTRWVHFAGSI